MTVKIAQVKDCTQAYTNAKLHLVTKYGLAMLYANHSLDFETEFGAQIIRNDLMEEVMIWPTEEEYLLWLLKWS